jgi:hypothetical protein
MLIVILCLPLIILGDLGNGIADRVMRCGDKIEEVIE